MTVSVFTPSHDPRWLDDAAVTLVAQTHRDWEWVVLLNAGATWSPRIDDRRIKVHTVGGVGGIGDAKRRTVALTCGEVLVELDHDDLLLPDALASVTGSLSLHPDRRFVYSDFAEVASDGGRRDSRFDVDHGWRYSDFLMGGQAMDRCHAMAPLPRNVSLIWYAPNHLRAFTRDLYDEVGGYDAAATVLDDQDLMCRMYERTAFAHLDRCLYLQRRHPCNTQSQPGVNDRIQVQTVLLAHRWLERLTQAWAERERLAALDLSPFGPRPGYAGPPNQSPAPDGPADPLRIDAGDDSVGVLRAVNVPRHGRHRKDDLVEIHRVLAHGGLARLPGDGWTAAADLLPTQFLVADRPAPIPSGSHRSSGSRCYTDLVAVKDGDRMGGVPAGAGIARSD